MIESDAFKRNYNIDFERIKELISMYEEKKRTGEIKRYNEESTKKDFILPLFKALGWNVDNRGKSNDSVSAEETISKKRVDYGFRINGIPQFFLEAKSLKEENIQTNFKYVTQAIDYAWMKSCSWAILTNFETIAVYNADWKESNYGNNLFFVLHPNDFLLTDSRFVYLSKGAFEDNELDKTASKYGKKQFKNPINKQLLQDMIHFREILSKDIVRNNQDKHLTQDDIDESVQRILDRLIFIRNAEDRGLEENQLQSNVRQWYAKGKGHLVKEISRIYKDYDNKYNSKLFAHHLCDDLYIENEALQEVIEGLNRSKDYSYRYDFSIIESDVLGNIYEQYLGNILKSTPKRANLEESKTHRKEQGIYYTPSYIVDYIVKNTVGEYIKNHSPEEIRKVRIVDPACGSGSFLIRAYKELENYWEQQYGTQETLKFDEGESFYSMKVEILKNNIFGVDLDPKAVEIAQLNLLLQISERKHRLPLLQNNIKVGNSLIDDPSVSDKAFKWEEEFPEIMKEGGFDIVIGNPPYGADLNMISKEFLTTKFKKDKTGNSASFFIWNSINILKLNGIFGMIVPKQLTYITNWKGTRNLLLDNRILHVIDVSEAFGDVELEQVIVIVNKAVKNSGKVVVGFSNKNAFEIRTISQKWFSVDRFPLWISKDNESIFKKILENSVPLFTVVKLNWGGMVAKFLTTKETSDTIPCVRGREVQRYRFKTNWYIPKKDIIESYYVKGEKLLFQRIVSRFGEKLVSNYRNARIVCAYANDDYYADKTVTLVWGSSLDLKFLAGLFNSKLISWFAHRYLYNRSQLTMEFMYNYAKNFPIRTNIPTNLMEQVKDRVEKITSILSTLEISGKLNLDKNNEALELAEKLSSEIDQIVFEMYGLTEKEISIVENDFSYWPLTSLRM